MATEQMTTNQVSRKLSANRGHLTHELRRVTEETQRFENNNSTGLSKELRSLEAKVRKRLTTMSLLYEMAIELEETDVGRKELKGKADDVEQAGNESLNLIENTLKDWDALHEDEEQDDDAASVHSQIAEVQKAVSLNVRVVIKRAMSRTVLSAEKRKNPIPKARGKVQRRRKIPITKLTKPQEKRKE